MALVKRLLLGHRQLCKIVVEM